jgi:hypothetical protein
MYVQTENTVILDVLVSASFVYAHRAQCSSLPVFSSERAVTTFHGTNLTRKKNNNAILILIRREFPDPKESNRRCCLCNYLYTAGWIRSNYLWFYST